MKTPVGTAAVRAPVLPPESNLRTRKLVIELEADGKGVVSLRTTDDLVTDCRDWGAASCR